MVQVILPVWSIRAWTYCNDYALSASSEKMSWDHRASQRASGDEMHMAGAGSIDTQMDEPKLDLDTAPSI